MRAFSGDLCLARAAANCCGTAPGAVRQRASRRPRLVPKRWMSVAGTTPASLATSARVSCVGLRRCMTRAVAARISSSEVWRGRGLMAADSITEWAFIFPLTLVNERLLSLADLPEVLQWTFLLRLPIRRQICAAGWRWWRERRAALGAARRWRWGRRARPCIAPVAARGRIASHAGEVRKRRLIIRDGRRPSKRPRRWSRRAADAALP